MFIQYLTPFKDRYITTAPTNNDFPCNNAFHFDNSIGDLEIISESSNHLDTSDHCPITDKNNVSQISTTGEQLNHKQATSKRKREPRVLNNPLPTDNQQDTNSLIPSNSSLRRPLIINSQTLKRPTVRTIRILNKPSEIITQSTTNNNSPDTSNILSSDDLKASFDQLNQDIASYYDTIPLVAQPVTTTESGISSITVVQPLSSSNYNSSDTSLSTIGSHSQTQDNTAIDVSQIAYYAVSSDHMQQNDETRLRVTRIIPPQQLLSIVRDAELARQSEILRKAERKIFKVKQIKRWLNTQSVLYERISDLVGYILFHRNSFCAIFGGLHKNLVNFAKHSNGASKSTVLIFINTLERIRQVQEANGDPFRNLIEQSGPVLAFDSSDEEMEQPKKIKIGPMHGSKELIEGKSPFQIFPSAYKACFPQYCISRELRNVTWECIPLLFNLSDYFNDNLKIDYLRYMAVPDDYSNFNVFSSPTLTEGNDEFLIHWLFDWLQYLSTLHATSLFNEGELPIYGLDLSPSGAAVNASILLYCALTNSKIAISTRDNPTALALWQQGLSTIFRKNETNLNALINKLSSDIACIKSKEMRKGVKSNSNYIPGSVVKDLEPAFSKFTASVVYLIRMALFAVHSQAEN